MFLFSRYSRTRVIRMGFVWNPAQLWQHTKNVLCLHNKEARKIRENQLENRFRFSGHDILSSVCSVLTTKGFSGKFFSTGTSQTTFPISDSLNVLKSGIKHLSHITVKGEHILTNKSVANVTGIWKCCGEKSGVRNQPLLWHLCAFTK